MNTTQPSVPAHFVNKMLTIAAEHNCDVDQLLNSIGLKTSDIEAGASITTLQYGELHHHIIELVQDEWFGLLSGGSVPKGAIRLLCQSVVHCKDLNHAINRAGDFFELCRGFKVKPIIEMDGDCFLSKSAKLDCIKQNEFDKLIKFTSPDTARSTLSVWHGFYSWLIGKHIVIEDIYYNFSDDRNKSTNNKEKYRQHYDQAFIGHRIHKKYLSYPIVQNENSVEDFMRKAPYYGLIKRDSNESLAPYVKSLLAKSIGENLPSATVVADAFNMSVTTLHRRLAKEKCSFQQLKDESRMEAAIHYLNCPDISTTAIADLLSFENSSTFYRSFKKWTGLPPGEYRKQILDKSNLKDSV